MAEFALVLSFIALLMSLAALVIVLGHCWRHGRAGDGFVAEL